MPRRAKELYLEERIELSDSSKRNHGDRVERFVEWCEENDLDNLNDLTGRNLHEFKIWRAQDVNNVALQNQIGTVRQFLAFCERIDAVPNGISEKVELPQLGMNEDVSDTAITPEEAEAILEYLGEYATLRHVIFYTLWHTGIRISTLRAFDVTDFYSSEGYIKAINRESSGTPLKNRDRGEREINLSGDLAEVIDDWVHACTLASKTITGGCHSSVRPKDVPTRPPFALTSTRSRAPATTQTGVHTVGI